MTQYDDLPPVLQYSSWKPAPVTRGRLAMGTIIGLIGGGIIGWILLICAAAATGAGHGSYGPAKLLFPYSMALTALTETIIHPLLVLATAQYPLYGAVMGWFVAARRARKAWLILASIHATAIVSAFIFANPSFTP